MRRAAGESHFNSLAGSGDAVQFLPEINRLRGLAILLVVLSHTLIISMDTRWGLAAMSAVRGATWLFVFVAGYLMAHLRHRYTYHSYVDGKVRYVVIPYIAVVSLIVGFGLASQPDIGLFTHYALGFTALLPLWFIPMIVLFFACFPIYDRLCQRPRTLIYAAGVACLYAAITGRPGAAEGSLPNFAYFQSAWLTGMAWSVCREAFDAFAKKHLLLIVFAAVIGAAMSVGSFAENRDAQFFSMAPLTAFLMVALQSDSPLNRFWEWLAPKSFGIFFLHGILTARLSLLGREVNVLVAFAIGIAITLSCAIVVLASQRLIGTRSRLLLGS